MQTILKRSFSYRPAIQFIGKRSHSMLKTLLTLL